MNKHSGLISAVRPARGENSAAVAFELAQWPPGQPGFNGCPDHALRATN